MLKKALGTAAAKSIRRSRSMFRLAEAASFARFKREIDAAATRRDLRLHLGCGPHILDGWINVDMRLAPRILTARLPNALKRFPSESARFIYASHVLEHIEYPGEAIMFSRECCRILGRGGVLRVVVPGIEKIIRAYAANDDEFFAVQRKLQPPHCTTKLENLMYALQQDGAHKYGYDLETITKLFNGIGFTRIVLSDYNTSEFPELRMDYRGYTDHKGRYLSLYVEAIK